jgi:hypothetical protein
MNTAAAGQPTASTVPDAVHSGATVSVIVVVIGPTEPLDAIYLETAVALRSAGYRFEFTVIYDRDHSGRVAPLHPLVRAGEPITLLEAAQNVGETALLRSALDHCTGAIIVTLPPHRRVASAGLPALIRRLEESGAHLVAACRAVDGDPWLNRVQRRIVHRLVRSVVGGDFHDLGSGVRVMRAEVLHEMPLYGESSRFLPLLAQREGFLAEELVVPQHAADRRTRVYSPGIYLRRFIDLVGVFFLLRFREKPLRFFGMVGATLTTAGGALLLVLFVQRVLGQGLADRPLLLLAVLLAVIGLQAIALGLVGEIIVHASARRSRSYRVFHRARPEQ